LITSAFLSGAQQSLESLKMEMGQIRKKLTAFATGNEAMAADLRSAGEQSRAVQ